MPNGEGDIPQPPTGDTFFDPIRDEQARMKSDEKMQQLIQSMIKSGDIIHPGSRRAQQLNRKLARGGVVKKFQNGGLAEATTLGPPEEEEQDITSEQLVERTTNPAAEQSLSEMNLIKKQGEIERLRTTR